MIAHTDHGSKQLRAILEDPATPRWLREIHEYLAVKAQFVLHGNIRDLVAYPAAPGQYDLLTVPETIVDTLALQGYKHFFFVDPVHGITILVPGSADDPTRYAEHTREWVGKCCAEALHLSFAPRHPGSALTAEAPFPLAVEFAEQVVLGADERTAILFDYLMGTTEGGQTRDSQSFIRSLIASYEARPSGGFNTIFWLTDRDNDLPAWFAISNPRIRVTGVGKPDKLVRQTVAASLLTGIPNYANLDSDAEADAVSEFTSQTDGMSLYDLAIITNFCVDRGMPATRIGDAARSYKLGVTDDPWARMGKKTLERAERITRERVCGQSAAITKTIDIVRRALKGLSGAQAGKATAKPKGVLFFAGPTGVGKTELAKSLTEALFGDERAYIRFDMSEFNHEHADQRLIGAPPGYVGFDSGGELTDAVRERPCSVILFDEIEKANGKILDKFLQILDEGQLTSGKGERVYFSDSLIIFTSNLGISEEVTSDLSYPELERSIRNGVVTYFKTTLGRPELLNRIGDNIVVFDFIQPDVATVILDKMLSNIVKRIKDTQGLELSIQSGVRDTLLQVALGDLSNGGRGIGNMLESSFVNPLARALWDLDSKGGDRIAVLDLTIANGIPQMRAERLG